MTSKEQLYLSMEKSAMPWVKNTVGQAGGWLAKKVSQKRFTSGLAAPLSKLYGGAQKIYGRGQQAVAGMRNDAGLFARGQANVAKGTAQREAAGLRAGVLGPGIGKAGPANPWQYRVGRGVGAVGLGAPLAFAPITASGLMGSYSADPELVKGYAKGQVQDRINQHMQQFASMPFMDRMRTAWNPEEFNNNILANSAQYQDLNAGVQGGHATNNPGIMKYLASFNPFLGLDPVKQKVRSEILNAAGMGKSGSENEGMEKVANPLFDAAKIGLKSGWGALKGSLLKARGNIPVYSKSMSGIADRFSGRHLARNSAFDIKNTFSPPIGVRRPGTPSYTLGQQMVGKGIYNTMANPGKAALGVAGTIATPYFIGSAYGEGKNKVYDQAANDAIGLADAQFTNQFAGMNPFMRMGGALFPGMAQDYVNGQMNNLMYPGQQYASPTDRGAAIQQQAYTQRAQQRRGIPPGVS